MSKAEFNRREEEGEQIYEEAFRSRKLGQLFQSENDTTSYGCVEILPVASKFSQLCRARRWVELNDRCCKPGLQ
jgi:hypothetical protein